MEKMGHINDVELIKLVETFPILYNKDQSRGHKNAAMKDDAWKQVSLALRASERACITRWKSIRDRFGKEYRRVHENPDEPTNWDLFRHLLFLKDHYKHGQASNDGLTTIKYEPKQRKRKGRVSGFTSQGEDEDDDDLDPNELLANQQLIALVRDHPVLYDKQKIRDSKNLTAKNDAWKEISESLGITEEVCYRRWKQLRDRFAREYRQQQLYPDRPVTWTYFQELVFLERHYRKGIPLPVEAIKGKTNETLIEETSPWGSNNTFDCADTKHDILEEFEELPNEIITESTEEYVDAPTDEKPCPSKLDKITVLKVESIPAPVAVRQDTEEKLTGVISTIEELLFRSNDCLKSLRQQNQRYKEELESGIFASKPNMLQKVHVLLGGLSEGNRTKAERTIVQFLCECQIKDLNNEDIGDIDII